MSKQVFTELKKAIQSLNSLIEQKGDGEVTDQLSDFIGVNPDMRKAEVVLQLAFENSRLSHEAKSLSFGSCLYRINDSHLLSLFEFLEDVEKLCKSAENNPTDPQAMENVLFMTKECAERVRWRLDEFQEDVSGEFYERLQLYRSDLDRLNELIDQVKKQATV